MTFSPGSYVQARHTSPCKQYYTLCNLICIQNFLTLMPYILFLWIKLLSLNYSCYYIFSLHNWNGKIIGFLFVTTNPEMRIFCLKIIIQSSLVYFKSRLSQVERLVYFTFHAPLHAPLFHCHVKLCGALIFIIHGEKNLTIIVGWALSY